MSKPIATFINEQQNKIVRVVKLENLQFQVRIYVNSILTQEKPQEFTSDWDAVREAAGECFSYLRR